jgi:hypothetical protein
MLAAPTSSMYLPALARAYATYANVATASNIVSKTNGAIAAELALYGHVGVDDPPLCVT